MTAIQGNPASDTSMHAVDDMTIRQLDDAKAAELEALHGRDPDAFQLFQDHDSGRYVGGGDKPIGWVVAAGIAGFALGFAAVGGLMARDRSVPGAVIAVTGLLGGGAGAAGLGWVTNRLLVVPGEQRDRARLESMPELERILTLQDERDRRRPPSSGRPEGTIAENHELVADRLMERFDTDHDSLISTRMPRNRDEIPDNERIGHGPRGYLDHGPLLREINTDGNAFVDLAELRAWASRQDRAYDDLDYVIESRSIQHMSTDGLLGDRDTTTAGADS